MAASGIVAVASIVSAVTAVAGTAISIDAQRNQARNAQLLAQQEQHENAVQMVLQSHANEREQEQVQEQVEEEISAVSQRSALIKAQGRAEFAAGNVLLGAGGTALDWENDLDFATQLDIGALDTEAKRIQQELSISGADAVRLASARSNNLSSRIRAIGPTSRRNQASTLLSGVGRTSQLIGQSASAFGEINAAPR